MPYSDRIPPRQQQTPLPAEPRCCDAAPATPDELEVLRAKVDRIDESLLNGLRERIACCADIADVKRRSGMPVRQPDRAGVVQRRVARFAAENDIDDDFLRRVYHLIIEESCRVQNVVIRSVTHVTSSTQPSSGPSPQHLPVKRRLP
jgi:chorismate mutase-like protein